MTTTPHPMRICSEGREVVQVTKQVAGLGKVNIFVHGFAVSPDRRWILYTLRNNISDIMLVENFQ